MDRAITDAAAESYVRATIADRTGLTAEHPLASITGLECFIAKLFADARPARDDRTNAEPASTDGNKS